MKNRLLAILSVVAAALLLSSCGNGVPKGFQEEADDTSADVVATFDYGAMAALGHPRVMITADGFKDLSRKLKKGGPEYSTLRKISDILINFADARIEKNDVPEYKLDDSNTRLLGQSRKTLERVTSFAYAYRITKDPKYLEAAKKDMSIVCAFKDWHPSHFLDVGEMALAVAIGYDWLYYDLPLDLRTAAHRCMADYALKICSDHWYVPAVNNWNQVCNAGMVASAIAIYEKDKALSTRIIEEAIPSNKHAQEGMYSPDGNYPEGYGYWNYGTGFETLLLQMLDTAFGNDAGLSAVPGFMDTGKYMLYMASPNDGCFSYADGASETESPRSGMFWFAAKTGDQSLLMNELRLLDEGRYTGGDIVAASVPCFIKDFPIDLTKTVKPEKDIWYGKGLIPVVMVHTGWNFDEGDVYLGAMASGAGHSHGHLDAGAFVFESQGVRWSEDLKCPAYATMENALSAAGGGFWDMSQNSLRWDILRLNNVNHSTLLFENTDGSVKDRLHPTDQLVALTSMEEVYDKPECMGAKFDLTPAYADQVASVHRTAQVIDGKTLRITDEVTAKPRMAAKMQWRMMTAAKVEVAADGETLTRNGKSLLLTAESSDAAVKPVYASWSADRPAGWTPRTWDPSNADYTIAGYSAAVPAGKTVTFVTTLSAK